jgi:hypothetical protein
MYSIYYIVNTLDNGHKNGYELFPEIKNKAIKDKISRGEVTRKMVEEIKEYAAIAVSQTSPPITFAMFKEFEKSGNRLVFENAYFERRKQLFSLVLAYILEENDKYIPVIEEKLWEWCELYSWELNAHFQMSVNALKNSSSEPDKTVALFAAESGFFFAEILSAIGHKLDDFLIYRLKKEIIRRVIKPYKEGKFWWEDAKMNWSAVCAGSVGAAAIYLIEDNEELAVIIERVLKSMDAFIGAFDDDGLITEGLDYWNYGFSFYVYFAELLRERTAGHISLLQLNEKIKKIAELPQILQFPSKDFVNFSDASSEKWNGDYGLFSRLEKALNIKGYNYPDENYILKDHTFRWAIMSRKLFWSFENERNQRLIVKTGMFLFKESQWIADRRLDDCNNFIAFAAKGGHNDEPHNHNDLGHFILNYNEDRLFVDLGAPEYVKQYFNKETRYDFLAASSLGHSVPVINNCLQDAGAAHHTSLLKCEEVDGKTYFKLNLKEAYDCKDLINYDREFIWDYKTLKLHIRDYFSFDKHDNEVKEVFITKIKPEQMEDGKVLIETENCLTQLSFDTTFKCNIEECCFNDHSGKAAVAYRTTVTCSNIGKSGCIDINIVLKPKVTTFSF